MGVDDGVANRQTQTHPAGFGADERMEQSLRHMGVQTRTTVTNRNLDHVVSGFAGNSELLDFATLHGF